MSQLKCQALPPISVSLLKNGPQHEIRGHFREVHLKPMGLLVVPIQQEGDVWYHVGLKNQLQAPKQITAADIPAEAQLLKLQQRHDVTITKTSFVLNGEGLQSIIDHIKQRGKLPSGARWLLVLLHPQITTDTKQKPGLKSLGDSIAPDEAWNCPAHSALVNMLNSQHLTPMQGRISDGLLNLP